MAARSACFRALARWADMVAGRQANRLCRERVSLPAVSSLRHSHFPSRYSDLVHHPSFRRSLERPLVAGRPLLGRPHPRRQEADALRLSERRSGRCWTTASSATTLPSRTMVVLKPLADPPAIMRLRVPGGKPERVADLSVLDQQLGSITLWSSLAPRDIPLLIRRDYNDEIYAYDLKLLQ